MVNGDWTRGLRACSLRRVAGMERARKRPVCWGRVDEDGGRVCCKLHVQRYIKLPANNKPRLSDYIAHTTHLLSVFNLISLFSCCIDMFSVHVHVLYKAQMRISTQHMRTIGQSRVATHHRSEQVCGAQTHTRVAYRYRYLYRYVHRSHFPKFGLAFTSYSIYRTCAARLTFPF